MTGVSRLKSRRSTRNVEQGRLGTAASGLFREMSSCNVLGSQAGAAGLLRALDTFPAFNEPAAARIPPSKRTALLQGALQRAQGSSDYGIMRSDSDGGAHATRARRVASGATTPLERNRRNLLGSQFASYRNVLVDSGEYEKSSVASVEASSVLKDECGPEKAFDGDPTTRWAARTKDAAGAYIIIRFKGTVLLNQMRFKQSTTESGGTLGEWASVVSLMFSDKSEQELVVNSSEEHGEEEQVFLFPNTACEWVQVLIKASAGNRGAAITDLQLWGYEAGNTNLLVRQGEKLQTAIMAVQASGEHTNSTIWIAAGTYLENLEVMCPVTLVALSTQPTTICSLDPARAALTCGVPGVYVHGLALLQAGSVLSTAGDAFTYDRLAPGLLGAHWQHEETVTDGFGSFQAYVSRPQDEGSSMSVWDRVKTVKVRDMGAEERLRQVAEQFPGVLADVVRYEEILASFEESGADRVTDLKHHSSELKIYKLALKKDEAEAQSRISQDRAAFREECRKRGDRDLLGKVAMEVEMLREELRAAQVKHEKAACEAGAVEDKVALAQARVQELKTAVQDQAFEHVSAKDPKLAATAQEQVVEAQGNVAEASQLLRVLNINRQTAREEMERLSAQLQGFKAKEASVMADQVVELLLQLVHETVEVAPELADIKTAIEEARQERKAVKAELHQLQATTAEAAENVNARVTVLEAMRKELEPCAVYAAYGAELVLTRCKVRSACGSGIVAGPRALVVARTVTISDCGRHGVFCHNGGRCVLDAVSILRCREYGALALHANWPPKEDPPEQDGDLIQSESAKPTTPKTPNFSRSATPFVPDTPSGEERTEDEFEGHAAWSEGAAELAKGASSKVQFGPPAIVARHTTLAYNGVAGVGADMGAEIELDHCGVLSNRREGLVASGDGTSVLLRDFIAASNGAQGLHVKLHAVVVAKDCSILGNGEQGCLVRGHKSTLKLTGGVVRLNMMEGLEVGGGGYLVLRGHARVDSNYPALPARPQAKVSGTGSWLDSEASSIGASSAYPGQVACENGGRAHLHWPTVLELVEDSRHVAMQPHEKSTYKIYRKEGRTLDMDQAASRVSGECLVRIKCHASPELAAPVVREYDWLTCAAACNILQLAQHVRKCVQEEDARQELLGVKQRKPRLKIPQGQQAKSWRIFYAERATADESIEHEGDLVGPIGDRPLWDVLPVAVSLHLFPDDNAGPEAQRQKALSQARVDQQLAEVKRARALERHNKLARMYPEQREQAELEFRDAELRAQRHKEHMRQVRAAKAQGLGASDRLRTPPPDPEKNRVVKGKGRAMYEAFQNLGSDNSDWIEMKEDRSGDAYWWNPITGAISWVDPTSQALPSAPASSRAPPVASSLSQHAVRTRQEEDAVRDLLRVVEDSEASENDVRMALQRLKTPASSSIPACLHRVV